MHSRRTAAVIAQLQCTLYKCLSFRYRLPVLAVSGLINSISAQCSSSFHCSVSD